MRLLHSMHSFRAVRRDRIRGIHNCKRRQHRRRINRLLFGHAHGWENRVLSRRISCGAGDCSFARRAVQGLPLCLAWLVA
jgi:hypothetical protein